MTATKATLCSTIKPTRNIIIHVLPAACTAAVLQSRIPPWWRGAAMGYHEIFDDVKVADEVCSLRPTARRRHRRKSDRGR
jgi:hypothetical protein